MSGERNLSPRSIRQFAKALLLSKSESIYFEQLVLLNQAKSTDEQVDRARQVVRLRPRTPARIMDRNQYELLSRWYCFAIREMTLLKDFRDDAKWIAKKLGGEVSPSAVSKAIEDLLACGLLRRDRKRLLPASPQISTDGVVGVAIKNFHSQMLNRALDAGLSQPSHVRHFEALTVAIAPGEVAYLKEKLHEWRHELDQVLASGPSEKTHVYQVHLHCFRLTNDTTEES